MEDDNFYKHILDSMRDMVLVKGPESRLLWANKAFLKYYGMTEEELKGLVDGAQSNPDDTLQYVRDDKFVFDTRTDLNIPSEPVTNSHGEVSYFHTVKSPVVDHDKMNRIVGVSRLIEDREIQEQDLTELDAKVFTAPLRKIIDSFPIATMLLDHDLRIIKCNQRWSKLFGDAPSVSNTNFKDHYKNLTDLAGSSRESLSKESEVEKVLRIEVNNVSSYFNFKTSLWRYPNDTVGGVMIVATDVTLIKQNEETLKLSRKAHAVLNRRHTLALEASSVGIWEWDLATDQHVWDKQMFALYGVEQSDVLEPFQVVDERVHPEDKNKCEYTINEAINTLGKFDLEFRVIWPSGEVRTIRTRAEVVKGKDDKAIQLVGANWDITEEKRRESSLRKANKELSRVNEELTQFSYRTSHDLKAPLTTSKKLAEFSLKDIEAGDLDEAKQNLKKIHSQMERLESLVVDILALARSDLSESINQPVNFEEIIQTIREKLSWMDENDEVSITSKISMPENFVGDKIRLSQVLENLISNAIKYRNHENTDHIVDINVSPKGSLIQIEVTDNGIGIPEDYKDDVFKLFKRFHPGIASGSGLGLSIVKKSVDRMGGEIDFSSSNQGTCFSFSVPNGGAT